MSVVAACGAPASEPVQPGNANRPHKPSPPVPVIEPLPTALTEQALEMQATILSITERDSLRRFAELADQTPGFASNFDGVAHYDHWSLMRRTPNGPANKSSIFRSGSTPMRRIKDQ